MKEMGRSVAAIGISETESERYSRRFSHACCLIARASPRPPLSQPSSLLHVCKGRRITRRVQQRRLSPSEALRPIQRGKVHHPQEAWVCSPSSLPSRPAPISLISLSWGHFSTVWLVKDSLYPLSFLSQSISLIFPHSDNR